MTKENDFVLDTDEEILRDFIEESLANLDKASNCLVELEKNPNNEEMVNTTFRIFHSLKGSCGFFDFKTVKTLSHKMETLLSDIKNKERLIDSSIISIFLEGIDVLESTLTGNDKTTEKEKAYLNKLNEILSKKDKPTELIAKELLIDLESHPFFSEEIEKNIYNNILNFLKKLSCSVTNIAPNFITNTSIDVPDEIIPSKIITQKATKKTMRIDEYDIDNFMNYTGELIISSEIFNDLQLIIEQEQLSYHIKKKFKDAVGSFQNLSVGLQKSIMKIRKVSIEVIFSKYPKLVRDLSLNLKKKVTLDISGKDIKIDKSIIELIDAPIVHILRNSMDHGLELPDIRKNNGKSPEGKISITANSDESFLYIEISDDGKGIDSEQIKLNAINKGIISKTNADTMSEADLINLIYFPGFSMSEEISDISGRGVGMDVVLNNIMQANGTVNVNSKIDQGTTVSLKIPLTVTTAITQALIIEISNKYIILPLELLNAVEQIFIKSIYTIKGKGEVINYRDKVIPIIPLMEILNWGKKDTKNVKVQEKIIIAILNIGHSQIGFLVDKIIDIQRVVLKDINSYIENQYMKGSAVLKNGEIGFLLNFKNLLSKVKEKE